MSKEMIVAKPMSISAAFASPKLLEAIHNALNDSAHEKKFIASVVSACTTNPALQACTPSSIMAAALLGESLKLSPSPQLGQYYMVPYNETAKDANGKAIPMIGEDGKQLSVNGYKQWKKISRAQFQLGYKGYIQLALRSGYYKKLNVLAIKNGELLSWNELDEEIKLKLMDDEEAREAAPTIGYYAMFEYLNGFKKAMYWSRNKMERHALRYSKGYAAKKGYTFWEKDFDGMAYKTMLRQLISKWGIMTVDLQTAFEQDIAEEDIQPLTPPTPPDETPTGDPFPDAPDMEPTPDAPADDEPPLSDEPPTKEVSLNDL
ncbi:recombinase RecT [Oscillibacter sp.]|uniref:recombinase RecT n=1 Tax=Oscillibacter sp. TaxID=1945593 RepID=UPI002898A598|nr:recombinase RecT [Oscillibacter sp.]